MIPAARTVIRRSAAHRQRHRDTLLGCTHHHHQGAALTNLAGYRIYYGTERTISPRVQLSNVGTQTYVIEDLGAGTWYFAVRAVTSARGRECPVADRQQDHQLSSGPARGLFDAASRSHSNTRFS